MNILDLFTFQSLTEAINTLPPKPTRINQLKLFEDKPLRSKTVIIEEQTGSLRVLETEPWGAPPKASYRKSRTLRAIPVPHIPVVDVALPGDVQDVRAFGTEDQLMTLAQLVNDRLQTIKDNIETTLEFMRLGALKGQVKDGAGAVVCDLFDAFGITQTTIDFALGNAATDVKSKCRTVIRTIEQNLVGELAKEYRAFCSPSFFDALVNHPSVKEAYLNWQAASALIQDNRAGFPFCGIVFEEYNYTFIDSNGTSVPAIESDTAYVFPVGTSLFKTYYAPGDFNETVNTVAKPIYAKMQERDFGKGYDIYVETNPLPICLRPSVLIKITA